jgi:hypothetical protein
VLATGASATLYWFRSSYYPDVAAPRALLYDAMATLMAVVLRSSWPTDAAIISDIVVSITEAGGGGESVPGTFQSLGRGRYALAYAGTGLSPYWPWRGVRVDSTVAFSDGTPSLGAPSRWFTPGVQWPRLTRSEVNNLLRSNMSVWQVRHLAARCASARAVSCQYAVACASVCRISAATASPTRSSRAT